jgi:hypothetical protein
MVLAGAVLVLTGCGRKPGRVLPAEDAGPDAALYPRAYPNKNSDPAGSVAPTADTMPGAQNPPGTPAPAPAPAALPQPETPKQLYPKIVRPEDMQPGGALGNTTSWQNNP